MGTYKKFVLKRERKCAGRKCDFGLLPMRAIGDWPPCAEEDLSGRILAGAVKV